ncbi:peptidylprolyl isomerase [Cohnella zeiphila]|uniref:peptidylprolyl isomerase n=1 Tax=Cohnella zeiphila TaxID=2761120 RepID=A0A7X0SRR5_9BACL|nr:peptidylprolyl isomerase [Cohnella zeiphila]MBB6734945.1 peptidyl-prolyl cis-trans isomerase [Cohnella zeiphila]
MGRARRRRGRRAFIAAAAAALAAAALYAGIVSAARSNTGEERGDAVALMNGQPIVLGQLRTYAEVNSLELHDAEAVEQAVEGAAHNKLMQIEAYKRGLTRSVSYDELLADMAAENDRRSQDRAAGKVIYGVPTYSEPIYYSQVMGNLAHSLENALVSEGAIQPTDDNLRRFYAANRDAYARGQDEIKLLVLNVPATEEGQAQLTAIKERYEKGEPFDRLYAEYADGTAGDSGKAGASVTAETLTVDESNAYELSKYQGELYEAAESMAVGDVQVVSDSLDGGMLKLLYCAGRKPAAYLSFEEVKPELTLRYVDREFDGYLETLYRQADIQHIQNDKSILEELQ